MEMGENGGFCKNADVIEQIDLCMHNYEETEESRTNTY